MRSLDKNPQEPKLSSMADRPTTPPKAMLLNLPPELRLQIYDNVVESPLNERINVGSTIRYVSGHRLSRYRPRPSLQQPTTNLAMSCKLIANEVRAHMDSLPANRCFATLTVDATPSSVDQFHVQRAPCRITRLRALKIVVNLKVDEYGSGPYCDPSVTWFPSLACCFAPRILRDQIEYLFWPPNLLRQAIALQEIRVHVHFTRGPNNTQSKKEYDDIVGRLQTGIETELAAANVSWGGVARTVRIEEFTSDTWTERPKWKRRELPEGLRMLLKQA